MLVDFLPGYLLVWVGGILELAVWGRDIHFGVLVVCIFVAVLGLVLVVVVGVSLGVFVVLVVGGVGHG